MGPEREADGMRPLLVEHLGLVFIKKGLYSFFLVNFALDQNIQEIYLLVNGEQQFVNCDEYYEHDQEDGDGKLCVPIRDVVEGRVTGVEDKK